MPKTAVQTHPDATGDFLPLDSISELEKVLRKAGRLDAEIEKYEAQQQAEIDKIKARYAGLIETRRAKRQLLEDQAQEFCRSHRDDLLGGQDTQTRQLRGGTVQFKRGRASVVLTENMDVVVQRLEQAGFRDAVRTRKDVDKRVVLARPEIASVVAGLAIEQPDEVIDIKPAKVVL